MIKYIKVINNIQFTDRELDIIACLVSNRATKKIAAILGLSPKTVENYVRNIMLKLECNSRESIIDFVENSGQAVAIKNHYASLQLKNNFELEISKLFSKKNNINCLIICHKKSKDKNLFIDEFEKHLNIIGIKTARKIFSVDENIASIIDNSKDTPLDTIIYCLSNEFVNHLKKVKYNLTTAASAISLALKNKPNPLLFIILDDLDAVTFENEISAFPTVELTKQKNYYGLFFAVLQKLLNNQNIAPRISDLQQKYELAPMEYFAQQPAAAKLISKNPNSKNNKLKTMLLLKPKAMVISLMILAGIVILTHLKFLPIFKQSLLASSPQFADQKNNLLVNKNEITEDNKLFYNLPPRNISFTGRKLALRKIKEQLNKQQLGVITQTISGLGGVGKTQLAMEFAYQAIEENGYSAIFWLPAETRNALGNAYQEIAGTLQLNVKGLTLNNIQNLVHTKLVEKYRGNKILLILDNAPDYNDINNYVLKIHKQLTPFVNAHILITSRSQHWPEPPLILDIFSKQEGLAFVQKHLPNENINNINKLINALHFFPLALGQAVAYIKTHTNINDYLVLYAGKQQSYLDRFPADQNQYHESLWKTWNITLTKLSNSAKELLCISAYLDPDDIPLEFFKNLTIEVKSNSIEELRKYSLITMISSNQSFKIHRLLQEVIRLSIKQNSELSNTNTKKDARLKTNNYWLTQAIDLLKEKFNFDYLHQEQWREWRKYLPQAKIVASHAIASSGLTVYQGFELYSKYAMFLIYVQCDAKLAIDTLDAVANLIPQHYTSQATKFIIANINIHRGYAFNLLGQHEKTVAILTNEVLPIFQQAMPKILQQDRLLLDVLRVVSFNNNVSDAEKRNCDLNFALIELGDAEYNLGFPEKAVTYYQQAFAVFAKDKQLSDISQYYKIDTLWVTVRLYAKLGRYIEAEKIHQQAQHLTNKLSSVNQKIKFDPIYSSTTLAILMYKLGKFTESIQYLNEFISDRLIYLSPQHIRNAYIHLWLGFNNCMLGNNTIAKNNFIKAASIYKLYYPDNSSVYILPNLGLWKIYESLGEYNIALDYMQTSFRIAKLRYKDNLCSRMQFQLTEAEVWPTLSTKNNLGYWQKALAINQQMFGENHYQTARCNYMLGQVLALNNKKPASNNHYKRALAILTAQDIKHPNLKPFYFKNIAAIKEKISDKN